MFTGSGMPKPSMGGISPQSIKAQAVPAPIGGINAMDMLASMPPNDSIFQYNLIPGQYGCKVRTGYSVWGTSIGTGGVRTVMPYNGSTSANDRLFAAAQGGIYDVSTNGVTSPAAAISFGTSDTTSGYGGWAAAATLAGTYLLYCDESNGYYAYTEGSGWAKITLGGGGTQVSGVDPATFVWVVSFKERRWFVQKNTATAWYLPTGAVFGAATQFNFGDKFKHGGYLVALYTWTLDGGNGIDDYLVAISSGGDVIIYQGSDPSVATSFSVVGQWYIGPPPAGRRIAGSFGGDLYLLSAYGILPLTKLIAGILVQNTTQYLSAKITPLINTQMTSARTVLGWEVRLVPSENLLLISVPKQSNFSYTQFVQSLNTQGWAIYRDLPYNTGDTWNGQFYVGTSDGRILLHTGYTDNTLAINWSLVTSFQEYGEVGNYHRIGFIRPVFLAAANPSWEVESRYDYDLDEVLASTSPGVITGALWDTATWDSGIWTGDLLPSSLTHGGAGVGRTMSIGISGSSTARTILLRFDLMYDSGNYL